MWRVIVRLSGRTGRLLVAPGPTKVNFDDFRVAVTPLALHELHAVSGSQIYRRLRLAVGTSAEVFVGCPPFVALVEVSARNPAYNDTAIAIQQRNLTN